MTDMRKSQFTEQQIIGFLKQAESGLPVKDVCRQRGFSESTFYKWRAKYGGMEADEACRLKDLEVENARPKKLLAEAHVDLEALKGLSENRHTLRQCAGHAAQTHLFVPVVSFRRSQQGISRDYMGTVILSRSVKSHGSCTAPWGVSS